MEENEESEDVDIANGHMSTAGISAFLLSRSQHQRRSALRPLSSRHPLARRSKCLPSENSATVHATARLAVAHSPRSSENQPTTATASLTYGVDFVDLTTPFLLRIKAMLEKAFYTL